MPHNFLLVSGGSPGHVGPMLAAAWQLRSRGHGVRFIAREDAREAVEAAGYGFVSWQRTPSFTPIAREGNGDLHKAYDHLLFGPSAARAADTRDEIDREPTDAVLVDIIVIGAALAAGSRKPALGAALAHDQPSAAVGCARAAERIAAAALTRRACQSRGRQQPVRCRSEWVAADAERRACVHGPCPVRPYAGPVRPSRAAFDCDQCGLRFSC